MCAPIGDTSEFPWDILPSTWELHWAKKNKYHACATLEVYMIISLTPGLPQTAIKPAARPGSSLSRRAGGIGRGSLQRSSQNSGHCATAVLALSVRRHPGDSAYQETGEDHPPRASCHISLWIVPRLPAQGLPRVHRVFGSRNRRRLSNAIRLWHA